MGTCEDGQQEHERAGKTRPARTDSRRAVPVRCSAAQEVTAMVRTVENHPVLIGTRVRQLESFRSVPTPDVCLVEPGHVCGEYRLIVDRCLDDSGGETRVVGVACELHRDPRSAVARFNLDSVGDGVDHDEAAAVRGIDAWTLRRPGDRRRRSSTPIHDADPRDRRADREDDTDAADWIRPVGDRIHERLSRRDKYVELLRPVPSGVLECGLKTGSNAGERLVVRGEAKRPSPRALRRAPPMRRSGGPEIASTPLFEIEHPGHPAFDCLVLPLLTAFRARVIHPDVGVEHNAGGAARGGSLERPAVTYSPGKRSLPL